MMKDMLQDCIIDFKSNWDTHLPLIEVAYNVIPCISNCTDPRVYIYEYPILIYTLYFDLSWNPI